jgi:TRAP-type mannitol/chloroaromatic compound transport system substrate-binding protein
MHRRRFLAGTAVSGAVLSSPARAQGLPMVRWRLASSVPKTLDVLYGSAEWLTKRVRDATGGRFIISTHAAGEIVPAFQVLDAVQKSTVECGQTASYYYVGKNTAFAFDTCQPFGLNARQQAAWMYHGGGQKLLSDLFREYGVVQFPGGNSGAQMGGWFRKEVATLADIKGLRFRIGGIAGRVWAAMGAVPQQIAPGDTYAALEKGTIDAAEWVGPYDDERLGLWKVAKNYYTPGWWDPGAQITYLVNLREWEKLPDEYRSVFELACAEANVRMTADYDARNPAAMKRLLANGVQLRAFSGELLRAAHQASLDLFSEESAKNPAFRRIYESWRKFKDDQAAWWRVAELPLDSFQPPVR